MEKEEFFTEMFKYLTGHEPFIWQREAFDLFVKNEVPRVINIPTGCGKTALMAVWLSALCFQAVKDNKLSLPRRLFWIVHRRTIVDQATGEAKQLRERFCKLLENHNSNSELFRAARTLISFSTIKDPPIAISTLRGEFIDNREWVRDPSRPAIIIGTVDLIGSKLLFRGYFDGRWYRPYHAGLVGVDALIVHDESHLTPVFRKLLDRILEIRRKPFPLKPFAILHLSATSKHGEKSTKFSLEDSRLEKRIKAKKYLQIHDPCASRNEKIKKIVEIAKNYEDSNCRVIIYVFSPDDAKVIREKLSRKTDPQRVGLLTGEMRGFERNRMLEGEIYSSFLMKEQKSPLNQTLYLVSTSAGEVGINLDADHCVCDLVPIDHLIQRWGRVNRNGDGEAKIDLVYSKNDCEKGELAESNRKTLEYLKTILPNVSPEAFIKSPPPHSAFSPEPQAPYLTPDLIDLWSLTSIPLTELDPWEERKVELWLHGEETDPQTYLVWRDDVEYLLRDPVSEDDIKKVLERYRIVAREKLSIRTRKAREFLKTLLESDRVPEELKKVIIVRHDFVRRCSINEALETKLEDAIVLLSSKVGGLSDSGALDEERLGEKFQVQDVADGTVLGNDLPDWAQRRRRYYVKFEEEEEVWKIKELSANREENRETLIEFWKNLPHVELILSKHESTDEPTEYLVYVSEEAEAEDEPQIAKRDILLDEHTKAVERKVVEMGTKIGLPSQLIQELKNAAFWHDRGKENPCWQEAIGNYDRTKILAKSSKKRFDKKACFGYRHELGSVERAERLSDLSLHLIAASHGYARPSFPSKVAQTNPELARTVMCRFAELQKKWGWWELAYLETLLKSADALVSMEEME